MGAATSLDFVTVIFLHGNVFSLGPTPNLDDKVPVFISPSDRVARLYPRAPGSFFVALYVSQGYAGGTLTCLQQEEYDDNNNKHNMLTIDIKVKM
jgi:hypothetical protein